jgi:hypothetical protein
MIRHRLSQDYYLRINKYYVYNLEHYIDSPSTSESNASSERPLSISTFVPKS